MNRPLLEFAAQIETLDAGLSPTDRAELAALAYGRPLAELAAALRSAAGPGSIQAAAELLAANENGCPCSGSPAPEPTPAQLDEAAGTLARAALAPFQNNPALCRHLGLVMTT